MRWSILAILYLFTGMLCAQDSKINVEHYELSNGFQVYLNEDKNASNIYGSVWVNAGGKNDPADATGIAHYLEHMLFKGTEDLGTQDYSLERAHLDSIRVLYDQLALEKDKEGKLSIQKMINEQELKASEYAIPNEFDRLIKSIGSSGVNASTSNDYTNYYNYFPPNQLAKWLDIYAHRFQNPVFRLFQSELEAVYEEKNRAGDNLEDRVYTKFNAYIYGDQPYSTQTVLGSVEHLKNPSLTKMYQYFKDYYVANNMALVLCGNFDANEVKPLIEASFGKLKRGTVPEFPDYEKNTFEGRVVEKVRITPIKAGFMGYKLVPYAHPDRPALELIGEMMSNGNQTGFIDKLSLENEVLYAGGFQEFMEEDGSAFIFFVPKILGKSLKTFEEGIRQSFRGIAAGDFSDSYFESIKYGVYRNFSLSLEQLASRGRYLGLSFIYDLDPEELLSYSEKIRAVSKEEVQRVASQYYGEDYFIMQSRTGFPKKVKLEKPPYKPISERTEETSAYAKTFEKISQTPATPNFIDLEKDFSITDGYLYYTRNPLNDIFSFRLTIAGGVAKNPKYSLLAEALNSTGTQEYSTTALKNKFASLGATYGFTSDYNSFDISLTGLDGNFNQTLELLEELLVNFNPTEQTVKYLYNQRTTQNKINKGNPADGGRILYNYGLFGDQSQFLTRMPSGELKNLSPADLQVTLKELLANGFNALHYTGQKDERELAGTLAGKPLFRKNTVDKYTFPEARDVSETTFYVIDDKKAIQSYVYYVVNGEPLDYEVDYKKEAFNAYYTSGLSGLLFQEVREFRSLAYATGGNYIDPTYEPGKRGRLVLFTGSQADKTLDAVKVVYGLLTDMPIYETRLEAIREGLILSSGSSKPAFRDLSPRAEAFLKTGYTADPNELNFTKYPTLEFGDIVSFYENNIKGKPAIITIYGDTSQFDINQLKSLGKVIELKMEDILVE
ncbi:MAG: pitrilysin family protein [Robiginitalea sp.]|uniref:M16 family metallopeptidase n=1 Tax=Robiginitalea sp. TaxID=1902411 RepID=UPI003C709D44